MYDHVSHTMEKRLSPMTLIGEPVGNEFGY